MKLATQLDRGRWIVPLALLLGVLAPTACVLWFMNIAANNQRDASQRKLSEAYRGQLRLLRDRADSYWEQRAGELERTSREGSAPVIFQRLVEQGLADSVVRLDQDGQPAYPKNAVSIATDALATRADWLAARSLEGLPDYAAAAAIYEEIARKEQDASAAARAAQAHIRSLARSGNSTAALRAIEADFTSGRLMRGTDLQGRVIAADVQLLGIQLLGREDARYAAAVRRLTALVSDYGGLPLPAAQRRFLMGELGADFPTLAAERLAAQFLESGQSHRGSAVLEPSGLPDVWKLTPPGGRAIALYRTATVTTALRGLGSGLQAQIQATPPGLPPPASGESTLAGSKLPGWQISLTPAPDAGVDEIARRQTMSYLWVGLLAIAAVAIAALVAGQAFRRHWQMARLKTDLVASVSHELKTPLASMRLLVDSLLEDETPDARKTRDYLELIARENLRLSRLIENFLTFSRLERNRQTFEFAPTSPAAVVQSALEASQERLEAAGARLEVDVDAGLPSVRADEDALVTVLLNLLDNAYKYTPGEKHIGLKAFQKEDRVIFTVADNGIGIPAREQKRIFQRFYQVDRRLARDAGGCGLGLSIVEYIVRAHGGAVQVSSQPGKGSTFSVLLPCAGAPA